MRKINSIKTFTRQKQSFRWDNAKSLGIYGIDSYLYFYQIILHLFFDKNINRLQEDLGEDYKRAIGNMYRVLQSAFLCAEFRHIMNETSEQKVKDEYNLKIDVESASMPLINDDIFRIYYHLTKRTDLANVPAPEAWILNPKADLIAKRLKEQQKKESVSE